MRRAIFLLAVVFLLIVSSLVIGLGWYIYLPEKISKIIGLSSKEDAKNISETPAIQAPAEKYVNIKIAERAAYKRDSYAEINVSVINTDSFTGNAKLSVILYYARNPVASSTVLVENLPPNLKVTKTIRVNVTENWNAFDVIQIS